MSTIHDNDKRKITQELERYCRKLKTYAKKHNIKLDYIQIMYKTR